MISSLEWLGLAVDDPAAASTFYERLLGPPASSGENDAVSFEVGEAELRLKPPGSTPRGGAHVHYALSTGHPGYRRAKDILASTGYEEHDLDVYQSVYAFDPDDHCLEVANRDDDGAEELTGIFEIVLEVETLERAERWYDRFDPDLMDRGSSRRRTRLDMGPFELELWEPQRGIADAAPGAHVDLGLIVEDLEAVIPEGAGTSTRSGLRVIDPDGHQLSFRETLRE